MTKLSQIFTLLVSFLLLVGCNADDEAVSNQMLSEEYEAELDVVIASWSVIYKANYEIEQRVRALVIGAGDSDVEGRMEFCGRFEFNAIEKSFVLDFGEQCEQNGVVYSGKVGYRFDGGLLSDDRLYTVFFEEFSFNDVKISGVLTSKALTAAAGNLRFLFELGSGEISYQDGNLVKLEMSQILEQSEGKLTPELIDDVFSQTGTTSGELDQSTFHLSTLSPILFKNSCFETGQEYPTEGTLIVEFEDEPDTELNFGDGLCDSNALLSSSSGQIEIDFSN